MAGKPKPFRLTDSQRAKVEENIGLAWSVASEVRRVAWWLDDHDVLSMCCEALCRAVVAHERRKSGHRLGSFVSMQAMGLASASRSYALAACRKERRSKDDKTVSRCYGARPVEDDVSDREEAELAMAAMSERQRQAIKTYVMLGMSRSEASEAVGCSSGSIDVHARRGIERARKTLGVTA